MDSLAFHRHLHAPNVAGPDVSCDGGRPPAPQPPTPTALATFAHEVRNSIAPLQNAIEVIGAQAKGQAGSERMLSLARRQVLQITRLVDELVDAGQLIDGRPAMHWTDAVLQELVDEAVRACSHAAILRGHRITQVLPARPIRVRVDTLRVQQIVGNLLGNAIKYTLPGGEIRVAVRRDGPQATVTVSDNGIGIEPARIESMFRVFEQDPRARALSQGGVGLGLAIARRLAECQGGALHARSDGKDRGSAFTLALPVRDA